MVGLGLGESHIAGQEKKYAEAKAEYDEGIKRNPKEQRQGL